METNPTARSGSASEERAGEKSEARQQAEAKTQEAKHEAKQRAGQAVDQAKDQARQQTTQQKERASESLSSVARAMRETGDTLRREDQGTAARYVDQAAERVERFSGYLRERSPDELFYEAERYARREPALFLGGAFALGLMGARFLKSSSPDGSRYDREAARSHRQERRRPGDDQEGLRGGAAATETATTGAGGVPPGSSAPSDHSSRPSRELTDETTENR